MPELFQRFSGMTDAAQMQGNNASARRLFAEEELRSVQALTQIDWTDQAGADMCGVTHQESNQTHGSADHQDRQKAGYLTCADDGVGTLMRSVKLAQGS
jgi:hypothetical protein